MNAPEHKVNEHIGSGFDRIAPLYDGIARFFSFNQINKSQCAFLAEIADKKQCLILGGGSGYFLQRFLLVNNIARVTYVDASPKMIDLAKKKILQTVPDEVDRVEFLVTTVEAFVFSKYDLIVGNFFFDLFEETYVRSLLQTCHSHLHNEGILYVTDFRLPKQNRFLRWVTALGLQMLYLFFRYSTSLQTRRLPDIRSLAINSNFAVYREKHFSAGLLSCNLYKKL